jgi:hypothetical protein
MRSATWSGSRRAWAFAVTAFLVLGDAACSLLLQTSDLGSGIRDGGDDAVEAGEASTVEDAMPEVDADADGDADAKGGEHDDPGILCDNTYCTGTDTCCIESQTSFACESPGNCSRGYLACDDPYDCTRAGFTNTVCCAAISGGAIESSKCMSLVVCAGSVVLLCDPLDAVPCPPEAGTCQTTSLLGGALQHWACQP